MAYCDPKDDLWYARFPGVQELEENKWIREEARKRYVIEHAPIAVARMVSGGTNGVKKGEKKEGVK